MKTEVLFIREQIEVGALRNGRPGYRWTTGYYVCDPQRGKIFPPVILKEAYALPHELFGDNIEVKIE